MLAFGAAPEGKEKGSLRQSYMIRFVIEIMQKLNAVQLVYSSGTAPIFLTWALLKSRS